MLTVSRKTAETLVLEVHGLRIHLSVDQCRRGRVKLAVQAPAEVRIWRGELLPPEGPSPSQYPRQPSTDGPA